MAGASELTSRTTLDCCVRAVQTPWGLGVLPVLKSHSHALTDEQKKRSKDFTLVAVKGEAPVKEWRIEGEHW